MSVCANVPNVRSTPSHLREHRSSGRLKVSRSGADLMRVDGPAQSLTTTNDAAVPEITGRRSQPGGVIGRSSGAATCTTTRSVPASTS